MLGKFWCIPTFKYYGVIELRFSKILQCYWRSFKLRFGSLWFVRFGYLEKRKIRNHSIQIFPKFYTSIPKHNHPVCLKHVGVFRSREIKRKIKKREKEWEKYIKNVSNCFLLDGLLGDLYSSFMFVYILQFF